MTQWIRELVMLVIVLTFLELLAPQNTLKRYVHLVVGFLIMTAVLTPALSLIRGGDALRSAVESVGRGAAGAGAGSPAANERLVRTNRRLEHELTAQRLQTYLEGELGRAAGAAVGVNVRLGESGTLEGLSITAPPGRGEYLRAQAAELSGMGPEQILVVEEERP